MSDFQGSLSSWFMPQTGGPPSKVHNFATVGAISSAAANSSAIIAGTEAGEIMLWCITDRSPEVFTLARGFEKGGRVLDKERVATVAISDRNDMLAAAVLTGQGAVAVFNVQQGSMKLLAMEGAVYIRCALTLSIRSN